MASGDDDLSPPADATEAVDVRDVVRELSSLLDLRERQTDEVQAALLPTTDEREVAEPPPESASGDVTIGTSAISRETSSPSGSIPPRDDPTLALMAIHLGEHENTGEQDMDPGASNTDPAAISSPAGIAPVDVPRPAEPDATNAMELLAAGARVALLAAGTTARFDAGATIARRDEAAASLAIVQKGHVRALVEETVVDVLGPGDVVGASMVTDGRHAATYVAVQPTEVVQIAVGAVKAWAGAHAAGLVWLEQVVHRFERARVLLGARAFSRIPPELLAPYAEACTERPVGEGITLFAEGDAPEAAFVVISGRFRITRRSEAAAVGAPKEGDAIGVASAVSGAPRAATVVATTDARVLEVPAAVLQLVAAKLKTKPSPSPAEDASARDAEAPTTAHRSIPPEDERRAVLDAPSRRVEHSKGLPEPIPPLTDAGPAPLRAPRLPSNGVVLSWSRLGYAGQGGRIAMSALFAVVAGLLVVAPPLLAGVFVQRVVVAKDTAELGSMLTALAASIVAYLVARYASRALAERAAASATATFQEMITQALMVVRISDATAIAPMVGGAPRVARIWSSVVFSGIGALVQLAAIHVALTTVGGRAVLVVGLATIVATICAFLVGVKLIARHDEAERLVSLADVRARALLARRQTIAASGRNGFLLARLEAHRGPLAHALAKASGLRALGRTAIVLVGAGSVVAVLGAQASDSTALGRLVASVALAVVAIPPLLDLFELFVANGRALAIATTYAEHLAGRGGELGPTADRTSLRGLVRLADVVTDDIGVPQLLIRAGEDVVLVGESGSGHEAIARVIAGVEPDVSGEVFYDDTSITALGTAAIAQRVGHVEAPWAFDGTVLENITLSDTPDRERVRALVEALGFTERMDRLDEGYETNAASLGDDVLRRVAIARALYADPPILVVVGTLDALDPASANRIVEAMRAMRAGRTTVVATVHPALAEHAGRVLKVADGRIEPR